MQINKYIIFLCSLVFIVGATGCNSSSGNIQTATPNDIAVETPAVVGSTDTTVEILSSPLMSPIVPEPTPTFPPISSGLSGIRGRLLAHTTQKPLGGTLFYLTPGVGQNGDVIPPVVAGPQEQDFRIYSDDQGWFMLTDVPAGTYYMVIWAPLSWVILTDANGDLDPVKLVLEPDQVLDIGEIVARWPN